MPLQRSTPIPPTAPLRAQAIVALRSTPTRPPETNTYADACPIFIARGNTHDPSSDFDAYIDVDYMANSHANLNAATNCYGYPDDTTCNPDNGRGQCPTF